MWRTARGQVVESRMNWVGHMVRMKDERLPKRAQTKKQECSKNEGDHN